ncbi:MAG: 50S ribosomal protein L18 [Actinobacteria bacterium]|nr:50S ribosomal protein L18 [Actinomycetota bacterium]
MSTNTRQQARTRRHRRARSRIRGTAERPRLVVFRSNASIYAQVVDDDRGHTLVSASAADDVEPDGDGKIGVAKGVGKLVGQRALDAGITKVVFDRGGNRYHGRVAALADGAREAGLQL